MTPYAAIAIARPPSAGRISNAMAMAIRWRMPPAGTAVRHVVDPQAGVADGDPAQQHDRAAALQPIGAESRYWMSIIWRPIVSAGFSEAIGSWNRWRSAVRELRPGSGPGAS